jgi:hypothetical protein
VKIQVVKNEGILLQKRFQPLCIVVLDRHSQISNTYYHILAYAFSALCASMHCMIKMKCKTNYDSRLLSKVMRVESDTFGNPFICLFVLGLGLAASHGFVRSSLCLTIITVFAEFYEVTSSLCAIKEHFLSLDHTRLFKRPYKIIHPP